MIPKHVEEKIKQEVNLFSPIINNTPESAVRFGYFLAMEEMKPILDAAREVINNAPELTQELDILIQLLKQYDNDSE